MSSSRAADADVLAAATAAATAKTTRVAEALPNREGRAEGGCPMRAEATRKRAPTHNTLINRQPATSTNCHTPLVTILLRIDPHTNRRPHDTRHHTHTAHTFIHNDVHCHYLLPPQLKHEHTPRYTSTHLTHTHTQTPNKTRSTHTRNVIPIRA